MKLIKKVRPKIKKSTIVIAGGAGFIGSHLVEAILKEKPKKLIVIDDLSLGKLKNLQPFLKQIVFIKKDLKKFKEIKKIFKTYKIDIVFNLVTIPLPYSFQFPKKTFEVNTKSTLCLLELQREGSFKTLCHFSSSEVYGTAKYEPMDENHPKNPTTTYAAGKAAADMLIETYVKMYGLDVFIVRPFNNFGPKQAFIGNSAAVIPITIWKIYNNKSPLIHGSGNQEREFIYVKDTVKIIISIFNKTKKGETVNILTGNNISILKIVNLIIKILNFKKKKIFTKPRVADVYCHNGCNKKLRKIIKIKKNNFNFQLKDTINYYFEYFKKNEKKSTNIRSQS